MMEIRFRLLITFLLVLNVRPFRFSNFAPHSSFYNKLQSIQLNANAIDDSSKLSEVITKISPIELNDELKASFMSYAMSTILSRALPDARDGLKPVHRRVLYAMHVLNLTPDSSHRKCARIVGEVLGKFHPHGDASVYAALVRMAQDFVLSHTLVSGHGNFGSVDNDPPAAMRYTESRLSSIAYESLLSDIKENTVDFVPNFDGNEEEPVVLPARFPILLLNGASGIAVGMATSIPPHNLGELADALIATIEDPSISDEELFKLVPAPDFPTGGYIMGQDGAKQLYTTGHGSVLMRAKCHVEYTHSTSSTGGMKTKKSIIITELPYMTNKALLLEKIADLVNDRKLEGISDLRDESDRDGIRVVIELKKDIDPAIVQNNLFKKTALQASFSGNMLALVADGTQPQRVSLKQALQIFIDFRFKTIRRRTLFQLQKVQSKAHTIAGLLMAIQRLDDVINAIRTASDLSAAKSMLTSSAFGFSDEQSDAVLALRLSRLTSLEESKLQAEQLELQATSVILQNLMNDDMKVYEKMKEETLEIKSKFALPRRSIILEEEEEMKDEDFVSNDRSIVILSHGGYIKRIPIIEFEYQSRGGRGKASLRPSSSTSTSLIPSANITSESSITTETVMDSITGSSTPISSSGEKIITKSEGDTVNHFITCNNRDTVLLITDRGVAYTIRAFQIPQGTRTSRGVPLPQILYMRHEEKVTSVIPIDFNQHVSSSGSTSTSTTLEVLDPIELEGEAAVIVDTIEDDSSTSPLTKTDSEVEVEANDGSLSNEDCLVLLTARGYIKRTPVRAFYQMRSGGKLIITLEEGDSLKWARLCKSNENIIVVTKDGFVSRFPSSQLPNTSRTSRGTRAMKLREGDEMADIDIVPPPPPDSLEASLDASELEEEGEGEGEILEGDGDVTESIEQNKVSEDGFYLLAVTKKGFGKRLLLTEFRSRKRGSKGVAALKFKEKAGGGGKKSREQGKPRKDADALACLRLCQATDDVVFSTSKGVVIRQKVSKIAIQSRYGSGVLLQKLDKNDVIINVEVVPAGDDVYRDNNEAGGDVLLGNEDANIISDSKKTKKSVTPKRTPRKLKADAPVAV